MNYISTIVVRYAIFAHAIFLDAKCEASPLVGFSLGAVLYIYYVNTFIDLHSAEKNTLYALCLCNIWTAP